MCNGAFQSLQINVSLAADHSLSLNKNGIILDPASTVTTTMNPNWVQNQCTAQIKMRVYTNGVYTDYAKIAILKLFPMQKYVNLSSMANILSLAKVNCAYDVSMKTNAHPARYVYAQS